MKIDFASFFFDDQKVLFNFLNKLEELLILSFVRSTRRRAFGDGNKDFRFISVLALESIDLSVHQIETFCVL